MSEPESTRPGVLVDRIMLHDLVNHLTIALGHAELLLMEIGPDAVSGPALGEIREACRRAVDLVESWRSRIPPAE